MMKPAGSTPLTIAGRYRRSGLACALILLAATAGPTYAAPDKASQAPAPAATPISDAQIAALIKLRVDRQRRGSGAVIGVIRPSGRTIIAHGVTQVGGRRKVDGDTVFEVASLTKIFTALLLAQASTRGEVGLDDPLARYLPPGSTAPAFEGRPITLEDLATHGAGLPLRPANLKATAEQRDKYAGYTLEQLYAGIGDYRLQRAPGTKFEYSNWGFGLLGAALSRRLDTPYDDLLAARITGPLAMRSTGLAFSPDMRARLAQGYDIDLKPVGTTSDGALAPAGGLRSTANDMMTLLSAFVDGQDGPFAPAVQVMLGVDRPGENPQTHMALGWRRTVMDGEVFYWSNGSADGYRSFMGFNPHTKVAVVALINAATGGGVDDIGQRILAPSAPVDVSIPRPHHAIALDPNVFDNYVGTYQYAPDDRIVIEREGGRLFCISGGARLEIFPESRTGFFLKVVEAQIVFARPDAGGSSSLVLHQGGERFTYQRVK